MGFKLPGKSIQSGTSGHSSALKMVAEQKAASALKATDWASIHEKAKTKDARYGELSLEEYTAEAKRQSANFEKTGKWDAMGVYDKEGKKKVAKVETPKVETKVETPTVAPVETPRVEKKVDSYKQKIVRRKDNSIKKKVYKTEFQDESGKSTYKDKSTYRKDGGKKKQVTKTKDPDHFKKTKTKYDKEGVKKSKIVEKEGGRRTVTKTDKEGNVTTKSRRTLKGILTGKGKKEKVVVEKSKNQDSYEDQKKAKTDAFNKSKKEQTDKFRIGSSPAKDSGSEPHNEKFGGPNHKSHNWTENVGMQKKTKGIQPGTGKRKVLIPTTPKKK